MGIQRYVLLSLTVENKMKLGVSFDIKSFVQMIYILFELNSIPRVVYILFKLS